MHQRTWLKFDHERTV